jgi:hypothetical protein
MAAFEAFFVTIKSQSIELTYMYECPVHSMFLLEAIFFGMLH